MNTNISSTSIGIVSCFRKKLPLKLSVKLSNKSLFKRDSINLARTESLIARPR